MRKVHFSALALTTFALILTACGGGGSSAPATVITPPPSGGGSGTSGPTWTQGSFQSSATFKNKCQTPRVNTNDTSGSTLEEKHWLRSWSNETYLWYNEITDINPASTTYPQPVDYFDILRTEATTASGAPKDKFHFTYNTAEYEELVSSGSSAGYGARTRILDGTAPDRQIVIAYVESGSPAEAAGLMRGTEIIEVDGAIVADGDANVLNAGLFPAAEGETHTFVVRDNGSTETREVTLTSDTVSAAPVHTTAMGVLADGQKVGYMLFNTFGTSIAEEALVDTVTSFVTEDIDHLVLDLRYNGGGFLDISSELAYMIAGPAATNGKIYETLVFNDKHPTFNPVTGARLSPTPFHSTGQGFSVPQGTGLPNLGLDTVYVLSTGSTCSASESLINSLEGIDVKVVMIGTTTCGKPYGFYGTDNCGTTYFTIQFRGENDKGFGDYSDGFSPSEGAATTGEPIDGCIISDDFSNALGDNQEAMLSAALTHIETGACPAAASATVSSKPQSFVNYEEPISFEDGNLLADPRLQAREMLETRRILGGPNQ